MKILTNNIKLFFFFFFLPINTNTDIKYIYMLYNFVLINEKRK